MSEIVYSRERVIIAEGQTYQNPRFFSGAVSGVERVTVYGDWPAIVAAYEAAGVDVAVIAPLAPPPVRHEPAPGDFGDRAAAFIAGVTADGEQPEQSDADASGQEPAPPVIRSTREEDFGNVKLVPRRSAKSK